MADPGSPRRWRGAKLPRWDARLLFSQIFPENCMKQESPPKWMQEACCLPCSKSLVKGYLPWAGGYPPWPEGVPTLAGGTHLGWGVPTLAGGTLPWPDGYLPWLGYRPWPVGYLPWLERGIPQCGQTENITCRRTTYVGGNKRNGIQRGGRRVPGSWSLPLGSTNDCVGGNKNN